jgi:hypothetical protein
MHERLHAVRVGGVLLVSNSPAFVLALPGVDSAADKVSDTLDPKGPAQRPLAPSTAPPATSLTWNDLCQ